MTAAAIPSGGDAAAAGPGMIRGVTLICTLYNESGTVVEFLDAIFAMDPVPEEFIIVDGGSDDGTNETIAEYLSRRSSPMAVRHLIRPECNRKFTAGAIARGRNEAISAACHDLIAATDGGCAVGRDWLAEIIRPLTDGSGARVSGGWYVGDARSSFERCVAGAWLIPPDAVDPRNFLPSSRSIAFRKSAWEAVGGYPEQTYYAEDTMFNLALRRKGYSFAYVPRAIVRWRMKSSPAAFSRLVYDYGFGDGENHIMAVNLLSTAVKLGVAAAMTAAALIVHPAWVGGLFAFWTLLVARRGIGGTSLSSFLRDLPCSIFVKLLADASYLTGHLRGRLSGPRAASGGRVR